ncbi:hypothetical protein SUDANB121_03794 [Nocardiopsis dassonvillei]|uniref:hypothetical protein n=1 Tax=Nocardiopsis dassonvillei TaxID=2014 RepID=UPI003F56B340
MVPRLGRVFSNLRSAPVHVRRLWKAGTLGPTGTSPFPGHPSGPAEPRRRLTHPPRNRTALEKQTLGLAQAGGLLLQEAAGEGDVVEHRAALVLPGSPLTGGLGIASEAVAQGSRLALLSALLWIAAREVLPADRLTPSGAWAAFAAGITPRLGLFLGQFVFPAAAFAVFDPVPGAVIDLWVPADERPLVVATVVAAKNLTVIALTFAWPAGLFREFALLGEADRANGVASAPR